MTPARAPRASRRDRTPPPPRSPCLPRDQEHDPASQCQRGQRHRHPGDERGQASVLDADCQSGPLVERLLVGEQRRRVPVRAEPEQQEIELRRPSGAQLVLVGIGGLVRSELAGDPHHRRRARVADPLAQGVEQRLPGHRVIRVLVVGGHATVVAEPERRAGPVSRCLGGLLVGRPRGRAPGEDDVATGGGGLDQHLGAHRRGVRHDPQRDRHAGQNPRAASRAGPYVGSRRSA